MKTLLKFILIAILAVLIAIAVNNAKTGHIIIFVSSYRLDFSLISGIILIILTCIVLYYAFSIISGIEQIPELISSWSKKYTLNRRRKYLNLAMISFLAHDYKKAYKIAKRVITYKNTTDEEFIALKIAIDSSHVIKNNDKEHLIVELDKYNGRRYKLAKKSVLEPVHSL